MTENAELSERPTMIGFIDGSFGLRRKDHPPEAYAVRDHVILYAWSDGVVTWKKDRFGPEPQVRPARAGDNPVQWDGDTPRVIWQGSDVPTDAEPGDLWDHPTEGRRVYAGGDYWWGP